MIYACENCGFLFRRMGGAERCPMCEGLWIRPASARETERLEEKLAQDKQHEERT